MGLTQGVGFEEAHEVSGARVGGPSLSENAEGPSLRRDMHSGGGGDDRCGGTSTDVTDACIDMTAYVCVCVCVCVWTVVQYRCACVAFCRREGAVVGGEGEDGSELGLGPRLSEWEGAPSPRLSWPAMGGS